MSLWTLELKPKFRALLDWTRGRLHRSHRRGASDDPVGEAVTHATQLGIAVGSPAEAPSPELSYFGDRTLSPPPKTKGCRRKALLIGVCSVHSRSSEAAGLSDHDEEPNSPPLSPEPMSPAPVSALSDWRSVSSGELSASEDEDEEDDDIDEEDPPVLSGPHKDVEATRELLIDVYKYKPGDITIMIDSDDHPKHLRPTNANIKKQISRLVKGARAGDRFYFHFSGHSGQKPTKDRREEDGMNEFILPCDGIKILDNELYKLLVKPLHRKSTLIAVFDCCHSGSILDLYHWRCNQVYLPWTNKGSRRTASPLNLTRRKNAIPVVPSTKTGRHSSLPVRQESLDQLLNSDPNFSPTRTYLSERRDSPLRVVVTAEDTEQIQDGETTESELELQRVSSPIEEFCHGWCRPTILKKESPDVICLSSCADAQQTWEDVNGASMTIALMNVLREKPNASLTHVVKRTSLALHKYYLGMHPTAREYKKRVHRRNQKNARKGLELVMPIQVEINNFQVLQLSSHEPLDMSRHWRP